MWFFFFFRFLLFCAEFKSVCEHASSTCPYSNGRHTKYVLAYLFYFIFFGGFTAGFHLEKYQLYSSEKRIHSRFVAPSIGQKAFSLGARRQWRRQYRCLHRCFVSADAVINAMAFIRHVSIHNGFTHTGIHGEGIRILFPFLRQNTKRGGRYKTFGLS